MGINNSSTSSLRQTLLCETPLDVWSKEIKVPGILLNNIELARSSLAQNNRLAASNALSTVSAMSTLTSRDILKAWFNLRLLGINPPAESAKNILGAVVEIRTADGLDLIAAYADYSARYCNFSGGMVVWEKRDKHIDELIEQLLAASSFVVSKISSPAERPFPPPPIGQSRVVMLTPSGAFFGQGPTEKIVIDPIAGRVMRAATSLMRALCALVLK